MSAGVEEPRLVREHDRLDAVTKIELHQDVGDVGFHGGVTDVELAGNLRVRQPPSNKPEHVQLALGQLIELPRRFRARNPRELLDHTLRDGGREQRLTIGNDTYRSKELF